MKTAARTAALSVSSRRAILAGAVMGLLALGACSPRVDTRGNQIHPEDVAAIETGQTTRAEVQERLGSPSSNGNFGDEVWYYIYEQTETVAFMAPEVKARQIFAIAFDEAGIVKSIDTLDETAGEVIEPAAGATPTAGNKLNFFEQMIANLGRFNKKKK